MQVIDDCGVVKKGIQGKVWVGCASIHEQLLNGTSKKKGFPLITEKKIKLILRPLAAVLLREIEQMVSVPMDNHSFIGMDLTDSMWETVPKKLSQRQIPLSFKTESVNVEALGDLPKKKKLSTTILGVMDEYTDFLIGSKEFLKPIPDDVGFESDDEIRTYPTGTKAMVEVVVAMVEWYQMTNRQPESEEEKSGSDNGKPEATLGSSPSNKENGAPEESVDEAKQAQEMKARLDEAAAENNDAAVEETKQLSPKWTEVKNKRPQSLKEVSNKLGYTSSQSLNEGSGNETPRRLAMLEYGKEIAKNLNKNVGNNDKNGNSPIRVVDGHVNHQQGVKFTEPTDSELQASEKGDEDKDQVIFAGDTGEEEANRFVEGDTADGIEIVNGSNLPPTTSLAETTDGIDHSVTLSGQAGSSHQENVAHGSSASSSTDSNVNTVSTSNDHNGGVQAVTYSQEDLGGFSPVESKNARNWLYGAYWARQGDNFDILDHDPTNWHTVFDLADFDVNPFRFNQNELVDSPIIGTVKLWSLHHTANKPPENGVIPRPTTLVSTMESAIHYGEEMEEDEAALYWCPTCVDAPHCVKYYREFQGKKLNGKERPIFSEGEQGRLGLRHIRGGLGEWDCYSPGCPSFLLANVRNAVNDSQRTCNACGVVFPSNMYRWGFDGDHVIDKQHRAYAAFDQAYCSGLYNYVNSVPTEGNPLGSPALALSFQMWGAHSLKAHYEGKTHPGKGGEMRQGHVPFVKDHERVFLFFNSETYNRTVFGERVKTAETARGKVKQQPVTVFHSLMNRFGAFVDRKGQLVRLGHGPSRSVVEAELEKQNLRLDQHLDTGDGNLYRTRVGVHIEEYFRSALLQLMRTASVINKWYVPAKVYSTMKGGKDKIFPPAMIAQEVPRMVEKVRQEYAAATVFGATLHPTKVATRESLHVDRDINQSRHDNSSEGTGKGAIPRVCDYNHMYTRSRTITGPNVGAYAFSDSQFVHHDVFFARGYAPPSAESIRKGNHKGKKSVYGPKVEEYPGTKGQLSNSIDHPTRKGDKFLNCGGKGYTMSNQSAFRSHALRDNSLGPFVNSDKGGKSPEKSGVSPVGKGDVRAVLTDLCALHNKNNPIPARHPDDNSNPTRKRELSQSNERAGKSRRVDSAEDIGKSNIAASSSDGTGQLDLCAAIAETLTKCLSPISTGGDDIRADESPTRPSLGKSPTRPSLGTDIGQSSSSGETDEVVFVGETNNSSSADVVYVGETRNTPPPLPPTIPPPVELSQKGSKSIPRDGSLAQAEAAFGKGRSRGGGKITPDCGRTDINRGRSRDMQDHRMRSATPNKGNDVASGGRNVFTVSKTGHTLSNNVGHPLPSSALRTASAESRPTDNIESQLRLQLQIEQSKQRQLELQNSLQLNRRHTSRARGERPGNNIRRDSRERRRQSSRDRRRRNSRGHNDSRGDGMNHSSHGGSHHSFGNPGSSGGTHGSSFGRHTPSNQGSGNLSQTAIHDANLSAHSEYYAGASRTWNSHGSVEPEGGYMPFGAGQPKGGYSDADRYLNYG
jgi:hypothetical protein